MNIIPRRPFRELDDFFGDDDWFLPIFPRRANEPDIDMYETEKDIVAEVNIPDMDPKDVKVWVEDGMLRVKGEREEKDEEKNRNYWRKEICKGTFEKAISLPTEVDEERTEANYEKGVLRVVLPKTEPKKKEGKEIKVKAK